MAQSSCKRDTKSKSHPGMKLAPVRVFSCKHPLKGGSCHNYATLEINPKGFYRIRSPGSWGHFLRFSVLLWTGENDSNTLRVDTYMFFKMEKKSPAVFKNIRIRERERSLSERVLKRQLTVQSFYNFFIAPSPTLRQKSDFLMSAKEVAE